MNPQQRPRREVIRSTTITFLGCQVNASRKPLNHAPRILLTTITSACTCPGEDHPGPANTYGRAAPEIDIFEAQKSKVGPGGRVSQSAQMAPFSSFYYFPNTSADATIYNAQETSLNTYRYVLSPGSCAFVIDHICLGQRFRSVRTILSPNALITLTVFHQLISQQAISALTDLNDTNFAGGGAQFTKFGVEYWSNPDNRQEGFITWVADQPVFRADANTFTGDPVVNISNRLIPEEPMVRNFPGCCFLSYEVDNCYPGDDFQLGNFKFVAVSTVPFTAMTLSFRVIPNCRFGCDDIPC